MKKAILAFRKSNEIDEINKKFKNEFNKEGDYYEVENAFELKGVEELLNSSNEYEVLIIQENLDTNKELMTDYLKEIKNKFTMIKVIYIINNSHHKSGYVSNIFNAGIYNALFQKDANISNIVYISLNPRTRNEAIGYYGLNYDSDETQPIYKSPSKESLKPIRDNKQHNSKKSSSYINKVIYKTPLDYQKVIGIYSPYSAGKTVIASNLAACYVKNKISVTLIDTDYYKKDLLYYFFIKNEDFLKMSKLYKNVQLGKEIDDLSDYEIKINKKLKLFTDHRDTVYKITYPMIISIIRNTNSNVIIIDISRDLDDHLANEILSLCDERIIVADKMLSTLNGLPYKLLLNNYNKKNLHLAVNKDINIKTISDKEIIQNFKDIAHIGKDKYSLDFNSVFFIPNKLELIAESLGNRQTAYGKDKEFDESIEKIATSLYQMNILKTKKEIIFDKLLKR